MAQKKKKKKQTKMKPPSRLLLLLAWLFVYPVMRLKYKMTIDKSGLKDMKGPCVVLAPHTSDKDHLLIGSCIWPKLPTFVLSEHFVRKPGFRAVLKPLHVITKKMFCADAHTIMAILRAKAAGRIIVLFPEGRLPACGHSVPVTEGTAELLKKLSVPVYVVTANGAYLSFPKWATYPRRGGIRTTSQKLFDGEDLKTMPIEDIRLAVDKALYHNDEESMAGVTYRCKDMTAGLNGILRLCPVCGKVGTLVTEGGHIRCSCGLDATLDSRYCLHNAPFRRICQWYDWQVSSFDPQKDVLECDVTVGAVNQKGNLQKDAGEGRIRMDGEYISFAGEVFGQGVAFRVATKQVGGLPVTVGDHFDLYHDNLMYNFFPKTDPNQVMDFVGYLERIKILEKENESVGAPVCSR